MTPDEIKDAIDLAVDCMDYAECSGDDVDRLCGYVSRLANEVQKLRAINAQQAAALLRVLEAWERYSILYMSEEGREAIKAVKTVLELEGDQ